jgi:hypothetical protein
LNLDERKSVIEWRSEMCVGQSRGEFFDELSAGKSLPGVIDFEFV